MYDAIIIGARCAGAPTAMLLARQGFRVLLLERASFPSDHLSTLLIHVRGLARLKQWGLLDAVLATNCPRLPTFTFERDGLRLTANILPVDGVNYLCAPRRILLDHLLVKAAVEAGAELCEGATVQEIVQEDGKVTGVRARAATGTIIDARASIVVGADGCHSLLARAVQPAIYFAHPVLSCAYYAIFSGLKERDSVEFYLSQKSGIGCIPTNDSCVLIVMQWPIDEFPRIRKNIAARFYAAFEDFPQLAAAVQAGKQESRFYGTGHLPNFFRKPYGPGWALVGDAGHHKDPGMTQGIADAFRDAQLLADALSAGLSNVCPLEQALADYERRRNEAAYPLYQLCMRFASFEPFAKEESFLGALRSDQGELDRYIATLQGTLPASDFFAPEHLQRLRALSS
jgi:2-polyprenyl-6-methoxyphenol hydroxylase-like FAD-dependent oxidoreductase